MAQQSTQILFPVGRIVMGSLYKPRDKDAEGKPMLIKNGPDAGKPRVDYFIAVAIPKTGEPHWAHTEWGQKIWATGHQAFPQAAQAPSFAWKIEDGDSTVPNRKGRKPCDNEGWKGHWVVKFGGGYAPKIFQQPSPGTFVELSTPDAVKCGYWVQVAGSVAGNGSAQQSGVYINHGMVLFVRPDAEIVLGPDAATAFAGAAVSAALPGAAPAPAMPFPGTPGVPMPAAPVVPPAAVPAVPTMVPAATAALPTMVAPNPAFLAPAMPGTPPVPPAVPSVPAEPALTAKGAASGFTYAQYRANGWTDEIMRQHGLIA